MKILKNNIVIGLILLLIVGFSSCQNDLNGFSDYLYTTTYFPFQYPVRTLVLGETSYYDNSNDINHRFEINASMGGVYNNTKNRNVGFEVDPTLADGLYSVSGTDTVKLQMLPSNYYNAITANNITIPSGSFNGGITIQLTDAFFADPLSYTKKYVLPLRILTAQTDSILKGKQQVSALPSIIPSVASKWGIDPRVGTNWVTKPKNFTIFAVNYINKYHGYYLKRGTETDENVTPNALKNYGWENTYIEKTTYIPMLSTRALNQILYADMCAVSKLSFRSILTVDGNNNVTVSSELPTTSVQVNGTGTFTTDKEQWGGKKRIAFYLNYRVTNATTSKSYSVKDTLVIRDNNISFQEFIPLVK